MLHQLLNELRDELIRAAGYLPHDLPPGLMAELQRHIGLAANRQREEATPSGRRHAFGLGNVVLYRASNNEVWRIGHAWPSTKKNPCFEFTSENYDGPEDPDGHGTAFSSIDGCIAEIEERISAALDDEDVQNHGEYYPDLNRRPTL